MPYDAVGLMRFLSRRVGLDGIPVQLGRLVVSAGVKQRDVNVYDNVARYCSRRVPREECW